MSAADPSGPGATGAGATGAGAGADRPPLRVLIAGGGVVALEAALGLKELAAERVSVSLLAPNHHLHYRPLAVRDPFGYGRPERLEIAPIAEFAGARLIEGTLARVDTERCVAHTGAGDEIGFDALLVATGALAKPHFEHALTIDDARLDEVMHGLIQDVEAGYVNKLAFVIPGRMAWPLPIYELAMMTAGRAFDSDIEMSVLIVTPEQSPLAIFGEAVSARVKELLDRAKVQVMTSSWAEIPAAGTIVINPGARRIEVDRIVALPELFGPAIHGLPLAEHGFLRIDQHCRVAGLANVFAAGDITELPIKHGGLGTEQADATAEAIAAMAGAPIEPQPFVPVINAILLTDQEPLYLSAHITGGHGSSSHFSDKPFEAGQAKIAARFLAPYLHAKRT